YLRAIVFRGPRPALFLAWAGLPSEVPVSLPDTENALVSIVIPAYKPTWFEAALASACGQTYANLEIIVCDDSADEQIAAVVQRAQATGKVPIRYQRNPQPLGELFNTVQCIGHARGQYIKFLHDDDVLVD